MEFTFFTHQTVSVDVDGRRLEHWMIEKKYNGKSNRFAKVNYLLVDHKIFSGNAQISDNNGVEHVYPIHGKKSLLKIMKIVHSLK